ncbi:MAG: hypothetical protein K6L75_01905 [Cellvibrionaceae bacterium]
MYLPDLSKNQLLAKKAFLLCSLFIISGCTLVDIKNDTALTRDGVVVGSYFFDRIKVGETDVAWVQKHLGYPSEIIAGENAEQYYVYHLEEKQTKESKVFLMFRYRTTKTTPLKKILTCENDVVTKVSSHVTVNSKKSES